MKTFVKKRILSMKTDTSFHKTSISSFDEASMCVFSTFSTICTRSDIFAGFGDSFSFLDVPGFRVSGSTEVRFLGKSNFGSFLPPPPHHRILHGENLGGKCFNSSTSVGIVFRLNNTFSHTLTVIIDSFVRIKKRKLLIASSKMRGFILKK